MNRTLELPETVYTVLVRAAAGRGATPAEWIQEHLPKNGAKGNRHQAKDEQAAMFDHLLDTEFLAECAKEADPNITLESVREALAKIPGSMTADFIAERDQR